MIPPSPIAWKTVPHGGRGFRRIMPFTRRYGSSCPKNMHDTPLLLIPKAVEEAICFGWIDGQAKTIDAEKLMQRHSPRKPKSPWSETNTERAKRMIGRGLMTEAGLKIFKKGVRNNLTIPSSKNFSVPPDLEEALRKNETLWDNFQRMPPPARLMYVYWINNAKTPGTRQRRTDKSIELIAENRRLNDTLGR